MTQVMSSIESLSHLKWARSHQVNLRFMPLVSLVVPLGPNSLCQLALQQVHAQAHGVRCAVHVIPELKTLGTWIRTFSAQDATRVSVMHSVSFDIQVVATWEKHMIREQIFRKDFRKQIHDMLSCPELWGTKCNSPFYS